MSKSRDPRLSAFIFLLLAVAAVVLAAYLTPHTSLVESWGRLSLSRQIPKHFGDWAEDKNVVAGVINPQQQDVINTIYSETLSRTYVSGEGRRVMLSLAYGQDQRDGLQVHKPEVCYPAQGFQVRSNRRGDLSIGMVTIPVKRVETVLGGSRFEPVTYWMMVGEFEVLSGFEKKLAEMQYAMKGVIPDGLLFRVSSIDADSASAYKLQDEFISALLSEIDPSVRPRYVGRQAADALK